MLVKELIEQLSILDQTKRIGILLYSDYHSWISEPKIVIEPVDENNMIVMSKNHDIAYGITEK